MESLGSYLSQFPEATEIHLVGPMPLQAPIDDLPEPVIFVDGGLRWRRQPIGLSVGDGDSAEITPDLLLSREKDFSDLAFVLSHIPTRFQSLMLHGFSGGRRDHELLVWGEIHHWLKDRSARVAIDNQVFAISKSALPLHHHGTFSLICFEPSAVRMTGDIQYALEDEITLAPLRSKGLSNMASGSFRVECTQPVFVFIAKPSY